MVSRHHAQLTLGQVVLFGTMLPDPRSLMDPVLRQLDDLLEDETLVGEVLQALRRRFPGCITPPDGVNSARCGRRGTPAVVVLRLLVLKHLRNWSYTPSGGVRHPATLEREVAGSLVYRRFCRIDAGKVPDAKTMVRLGQLLHGDALRALFDRVVGLAVEKKVSEGRRMRIDTTVVETDIRYPTDSGLCEDIVRVLRRGLQRLLDTGIKLGFRLRGVSRSVSRRMREIGRALKTRDKEARARALVKPYKGLLRVTGRIVRQAERASQQARQQMDGLSERARLAAAGVLAELAKMIPRGRQVLRQTRARIVDGITNSKGKLVSIFETHTQILRRGKAHKPTEYGALVRVQESDNGIVTDIGVVPEAADAPLLVPAVEHHIRVFGHAPHTAATDRGFYSTDGEQRIRDLGVQRPVIPKPGHRSAKRIEHERQRWFRRGRAWRMGGEARISRLKHSFGMDRSRYRGDAGMNRTVLWAGIANNLAAVATRIR